MERLAGRIFGAGFLELARGLRQVLLHGYKILLLVDHLFTQ
jgi:hypothetical protein